MKINNFDIVSEGTTDILIHKNKSYIKGPAVKKTIPFYNPSMELNRDLSIAFSLLI